MDDLDLVEVKKECATFKDYNTYVFVRTHTNFYNGYILQIMKDAFMFADDKIAQPFPVRFDSLKIPVLPSVNKGEDFNFGRVA